MNGWWKEIVVRIVLFAVAVVAIGCLVVFIAGCSDSPSPQPLRATIARPEDPRLPMLHPSLADITNYHTPCRSYPDGRPRIETVSYPVVWIDDVASEGVMRLRRDRFLAGGSPAASHWFGDDLELLGAYGVPKGKMAVLEYRADDEASVYVVGWMNLAEVGEIPPPLKQPLRPKPRWYPFADITVQCSNAWTFNTAQADGWSYGDRELINQIVPEREAGTKFTLFHLKDPVYLPWSFAGWGRTTNFRAFLYGVHYTYPDGSEWDEFRLHGSLPISTWLVKPAGPDMNEEMDL